MDTIRNRVGEVYEPFKVRFLEREIHALADDEVLVRVRASAICGSDLHIARGLHPSAPLPVTIGHEFSGDVTAVGSGVDNVRVGQRVTVEPCIVCGKCDACRHGDYGYCEHISFTYRNGDGAMADYVVAKAPYVYELPEYLTYETGALIEPLSVATHAVRRAQVALGETVLIIGAGAIAGEVARLCKSMDMTVLGVKRTVTPLEHYDRVYPNTELDTVLAASDFVVILTPLTDATRGMIGAAQLAKMKPTGVLINIARGPVVDTEALVEALQKGIIGGAALDAVDPEPLPADSPLWDMEQVILTPHCAADSTLYMDRAMEQFCENLKHFEQGEPLFNEIDLKRKY